MNEHEPAPPLPQVQTVTTSSLRESTTVGVPPPLAPASAPLSIWREQIRTVMATITTIAVTAAAWGIWDARNVLHDVNSKLEAMNVRVASLEDTVKNGVTPWHVQTTERIDALRRDIDKLDREITALEHEDDYRYPSRRDPKN